MDRKVLATKRVSRRRAQCSSGTDAVDRDTAMMLLIEPCRTLQV